MIELKAKAINNSKDETKFDFERDYKNEKYSWTHICFFNQNYVYIEEKLRFSKGDYNPITDLEERNSHLMNLLTEKDSKIKRLEYIIKVQKARIDELEKYVIKLPQSIAPRIKESPQIDDPKTPIIRKDTPKKEDTKYYPLDENFFKGKRPRLPKIPKALTDHEERMKTNEETLINDIDKLMVSEFNPYIAIDRDYSKQFPNGYTYEYGLLKSDFEREAVAKTK